MMSLENTLLAGTIAATVLACSGPAAKPDAAPDCDFTLEWGVRDGDSFTRFMPGDDAEITLGFQGFRYITSSVRLVDISAENAAGTFQISVSGHDAWAQSFAGPTDADYVDVLVYFNDIPIAELIGRPTEILARVIAGGCLGTYDTSVTLKDDDDCLETPDGGLECEADAGP